MKSAEINGSRVLFIDFQAGLKEPTRGVEVPKDQKRWGQAAAVTEPVLTAAGSGVWGRGLSSALCCRLWGPGQWSGKAESTWAPSRAERGRPRLGKGEGGDIWRNNP